MFPILFLNRYNRILSKKKKKIEEKEIDFH